MKEDKKKEIELIQDSINNIYNLLDDLNERLVNVANIIHAEVKAVNTKIESGEGNKGLSREDIAIRRYILTIADKIQYTLKETFP